MTERIDRLLVVGVLSMAGCASHSEHGTHGPHGHGPPGSEKDREAWLESLDDPRRDAWQRPVEVVAALGLRGGEVVADVGAGSGYFEPHLARAVGPTGRVLALDVDRDLVARMQQRFAEAGLTNVEARLVAPADPGLEPGRVDRVLVVDTWHHMSDRVAYARKLGLALAAAGKVVIVDHPPGSPDGPPPALRLRLEAVVAELAAAGFTARVVPEALPRQFIVVGERSW